MFMFMVQCSSSGLPSWSHVCVHPLQLSGHWWQRSLLNIPVGEDITPGINRIWLVSSWKHDKTTIWLCDMTHHCSIRHTPDGKRGIHVYIHESTCRGCDTSYVQAVIALFAHDSSHIHPVQRRHDSHTTPDHITSYHLMSYPIMSAPNGQEAPPQLQVVLAYSPANPHDLSQMTEDRKQL